MRHEVAEAHIETMCVHSLVSHGGLMQFPLSLPFTKAVILPQMLLQGPFEYSRMPCLVLEDAVVFKTHN
jgi:hypothetical protein